MRLALYIKTLGVEPVPFQHRDYRDYAAALQQQYQKLTVKLDSGVIAQARTVARSQIKKLTLPVAAHGLVPPVPPASPKPRLAKNTLQVSTTPPKPISISPARSTPGTAAPLPERTAPGRKLVRKCRRKLAHFDFLSALHHAHGLARRNGNDNLNIYPCLICNGIHVGHPNAR